MNKLCKIVWSLIAISILTFNTSIEAKKCKKHKSCCKIITGLRGTTGVAGITGSKGLTGEIGPVFNNFLLAYKTVQQDIPSNTGFENVSFNVFPANLSSSWTTTPTTFQAGITGTYSISISTTVVRTGSETDGTATLRLIRNGTEIPGSQIAGTLLNGAELSLDLAKTIIVNLSAGDTISAQLAGNIGAGPDVSFVTIGNGSIRTAAALSINRIN